jgi:hypothetical protein
MKTALIWAARIAGVLGIAAMALAVAARLSGAWSLGGFEVGTVLQAGMAAVLIACLAYLAALVERHG